MFSLFSQGLTIVIIASTLGAVRADDLRSAVFRSADESVSVKMVSDDELEFTPEAHGPHLVCKYTRDGDTVRVVMTVLGTAQAVYLKRIPEGLQQADSSILYDASHFEAASRAEKEKQARREAAAVELAATPNTSPTATPVDRPIAVSAPTNFGRSTMTDSSQNRKAISTGAEYERQLKL